MSYGEYLAEYRSGSAKLVRLAYCRWESEIRAVGAAVGCSDMSDIARFVEAGISAMSEAG